MRFKLFVTRIYNIFKIYIEKFPAAALISRVLQSATGAQPEVILINKIPRSVSQLQVQVQIFTYKYICLDVSMRFGGIITDRERAICELLVVTTFSAYQGIHFARFRKHTIIFFYINTMLCLCIVFTTLDGRLLSVAQLDLCLRNFMEIMTR